MGEDIVIIATAGKNHLILRGIVNLRIPDQVYIKMIVASSILSQSLLLFIQRLIAISILVTAQVEHKVRSLAEIFAEVDVDGIGVEP